MNFEDLFNPSTTIGALLIGIASGLISGALIGFFSGKQYEKKKIQKAKINSKGNDNIIIQNSDINR